MEEWRVINSITGFENIYEISNLGNLRNKHSHKYKSKVYDKDGYIRYHLYNKGKQKAVHAHRLVLTEFTEQNNSNLIIDHINGVRDDNRVENLRWCTVLENNRWGRNSNSILVKSKITGRVKYFQSNAEASKYYGYNRLYFSKCMENNMFENKTLFFKNVDNYLKR